MRRLFSSILVILILFNVLGYYGLFVGLQYKNTQEVIQRLDSDTYNEDEAITLKIPLTVPYASDSRGFERVNGDFTHEGQVYRMVKQRLYQDTLYIVCIKDKTSTHIQNALADYVKTFTDKPGDSKQNAKTLFSFIKEYVVRDITIDHPASGWQRELSGIDSHVFFVDSFCSSIIHPPERA